MNPRLLWALVGVAALGAGSALWWAGRPEPLVGPATIGPAAVYAMSFHDLEGAPQPLGQFQGRTLVLNFWATWCAPCREEMPAFDRLSQRWASRGVAFVGISQEPAETIARFQRELGIRYPLWSAGDEAGELARRLGDRVDGLPFTVVLSASGHVIAAKVGPYTENTLDEILTRSAAKS